MNLALAAVLFLLLSLPGIAFRKSYYSSRFSISFISTNFISEIIWALVPSFIFHGLSIYFLESLFQEDLKIEHVGYLLSGGTDKNEIAIIFNNINHNISFILLYLISISILSALTGNIFRWIVRGLALDIYIRSLRYPNRWHYLFTGEYKMIERGNEGLLDLLKDLSKGKLLQGFKKWKVHKKISFIVVDVLISIEGENILYSGKLEDYYLSQNGGLDRIIIKYPLKKPYSSEGKGSFIDIPSDYLILQFKNIQNINISYIFEEEQNDFSAQEASPTLQIEDTEN